MAGKRDSLHSPARPARNHHPTITITPPARAPAAALQVWTQAPVGLGALSFYWTMLYVITAFQESKLHID